mmetsp:Transcript_31365/g.49109  ORF Transcript_31365/g.49109 Transcript_31365/m.49109 type:complete len:394 (+) Transcript_31365:68-1249(+)
MLPKNMGWRCPGLGALVLLLLLSFQLPSADGALSWMTDTQEMMQWCSQRMCSPEPRYNLTVGQPVSFNITAADTDRLRNLSLAVMANPGLPNEATLTAETFVEFKRIDNTTVHNAVTRHFEFTPMARQDGLTFSICFKVFDLQNANSVIEQCITIAVSAPMVEFLDSTAKEETERIVGVNCPVDLRLVVRDGSNSGYCMQALPGSIYSQDREMPHGAVLRHVSTLEQPKTGTHDGCAQQEFQILWYPRRGMETHSFTFCAHIYDNICDGLMCNQRAGQRCYTVHVAKCKYCLSMGETIMAAAARYNTDWLQLWGANVNLKTPDDLGAFSELTLGPLYHVQVGDTLESLAVRFGTTATNILEANPDVDVVDNMGTISIGDQLCILPWVCWSEQQ